MFSSVPILDLDYERKIRRSWVSHVEILMWETLRWLIVMSAKTDQIRGECPIFLILDMDYDD